jgi:Tfp pilus assembly protein PilX
MTRTTTSIRKAARVRADALRGVRAQDGWALVIALIVMALMLSFGLAILAIADTQSRAGGVERQRDAAFSVAEAALNAEMFMLANNWPGPAQVPPQAYPSCTQSSTDSRCPSVTMLQNLIKSPDTAANLQWQIDVYDDDVCTVGGQSVSLQSFYSDAYTSCQAHQDGNNNHKLWVRAQATVAGVTKAVVTQVQAQMFTNPLPHAAVVAGSLQTSNSGNKVIIDTLGYPPASPPGAVYVRCNPVGNPNCLAYDATKNQIWPDTTSPNYTGGSALSATILAQLKAEAVANGTYYTACPASVPSGAVVWIAGPLNCSWTGNGTGNAPGQPGLLILDSGTLSFGGTVTFYGLVYALNGPPSSSGTVVTVQGNATIVGGVFVDGNGGVVAGSSKVNIQYDPTALNVAQTIANVNYIQSTWRQL